MRAALLSLGVVGVVALAACAGSRRPGGECDPSTTGDCAAPDAAVDADTTPPADTAPDALKNGFGAPCTDGDQCESDICILSGTGGFCSQQCGVCPAGYGCLGVTGAIDPGQESFVCVKISDQLCSPCQADQECTLLGMDKCLTEATGRAYCSRDCSSVSCPTGYDCANEVVGGVNYKQCVPQSAACDCQTAAQQGGTDACSITTSLGTTCAGARTCGGTTGWGSCQPPSPTDTPDGNYTDDNCDGIDGDITKGIFVAKGGTNTAGCGLTVNTPCQTITFGLARAVIASKPNVYVQKGEYDEVVVLQNGVDVWGGYDITWQRGPYSDAAHRVDIVGTLDRASVGGDDEYLTVRAHDLTAPVTIGDVVLHGPDAQNTAGASTRDGHSSYVVHAAAATVSLVRVQIAAGKGAAGGPGAAGADAPMITVQLNMFGSSGTNGSEGISGCNASSHGTGGAGGTNVCTGGPSSLATGGGAGGDGGTKDTSCTNFTARPGKNGTSAAFVTGPFGLAGNGGTGGNSCGPTGIGGGGFILDGAGGGPGTGGYLGGTSSRYWYAQAGAGGTTGENGSGGGGGGGGGGCDNGEDAYGGGGGGGGAGGCAARGGGNGGGGGGGAFGIVAVGATISLDSCELLRGSGGSGGAGGSGGQGQDGAGGAPGGSHPGSALPGQGGNGARGGHAGGGGGGGGGLSIGIVTASHATINGSCTQRTGSGGSGGAGGTSAPSAPVHGNPGATGNPGLDDDTLALP